MIKRCLIANSNTHFEDYRASFFQWRLDNDKTGSKILFGIPIVIGIAVLITFVLDNSDFVPNSGNSMSHFDDSVNDDMYSNNLYSGPFAILDGTYGVDDTLFLIGDQIPLDSKGKIDFVRPDGKIHHTIQYDGSKDAVNHYFTPVLSSDLEECSDCELFGTWKISFRNNQGMTYLPITFEVIGGN